MNNGIEIYITIKMGDTCENTLSLNEARALFGSLGDLFSIQPAIMEPKGMINTTQKNKIESTTEENKYENELKEQLVAPNLKVEAARKKTAERTKGCGNNNRRR